MSRRSESNARDDDRNKRRRGSRAPPSVHGMVRQGGTGLRRPPVSLPPGETQGFPRQQPEMKEEPHTPPGIGPQAQRRLEESRARDSPELRAFLARTKGMAQRGIEMYSPRKVRFQEEEAFPDSPRTPDRRGIFLGTPRGPATDPGP